MEFLAAQPGSTFRQKTISEIFWPGSNNAGAYFTPTSEASSPAINDPYRTLLNGLPISETRITSTNKYEWAARQRKILDQLQAGSRWLQFNLYKDGNNFYPYHGLRGEITGQIAGVIKNFLQNIGPKEVVVIDTTFYGNPGDITNAWLASVFSPITFVSPSRNLANLTYGELENTNSRIILISNQTNSNYFKAQDVFSNPTVNTYDASYRYTNAPNVGAKAIELLLTREQTKIHKSFFAGGLRDASNPSSSDTLKARARVFPTLADYARSASAVFEPTVLSYPKLTWNVVLVDFVDESDIWEFAVGFNQYSNLCFDNSTTCFSRAAVRDTWQSTNQSTPCQGTAAAGCDRSCGRCPWTRTSGASYAGAKCSSDSNCATGTCYTRQANTTTKPKITAATFCLGYDQLQLCTLSSEASEACNTTLTRNEINNVTNNCRRCTSSFQCQTGYCNLRLGVCERVPGSFTVKVVPPTFPNVRGYERVVSSQAVSFRKDIKPLRPGNPDADYPTNAQGLTSPPTSFDQFSSSQPYLASIFGFLLIPIITAFLLFFIYLICYYPWCCCDNCAKQCCCDCFFCGEQGTPTHFWVPCGFLFATLVVILWACLDAQVANSELSTHLTDKDTGLVGEVNNVFDKVTGTLSGLVPEANLVVSKLNASFALVDAAIQTARVTINRTANVSTALDELARDFSNPNSTTFTTRVYDPAAGSMRTTQVPCTPCQELGRQIGSVNSTLQNVVFSAARTLDNTIVNANPLTKAQSAIQSGLNGFSNVVGSFVNTINSTKGGVSSALDTFAQQEQNRSVGFTIFFIVPLVMWIVTPLLGLVLKTKICFKFNWWCAMHLGVLFLFLSGIFAFFTVVWADLCVRLDAFEVDPVNSQVSRQFKLDQTTKPQNNSGNSQLPNIQSFSPIKIVNACFTGESLITALNVTNLRWDSLRDEIKSTITNLDISSTFTSQAGPIVSFRDQVNNLRLDNAFNGTAEQLLSVVQQIPGCNCSDGKQFTRSTLLSNCSIPGETADTIYAFLQGRYPDPAPPCHTAYSNAYVAVQAEQQVDQFARDKVNSLKGAANRLFAAYDTLYDFVLLLDFYLREFACSLNPIFASFDRIIGKYGNCGLIGETYGIFKKLACVSLFTDMYRITRALLVVGYMSILIVIFAMMMDDRIEVREEKEGTGGALALSGGSFDNGDMEMHNMRDRGSMLEPGAGIAQPGAEGGYGYAAEGTGYVPGGSGESVRYV